MNIIIVIIICMMDNVCAAPIDFGSDNVRQMMNFEWQMSW